MTRLSPPAKLHLEVLLVGPSSVNGRAFQICDRSCVALSYSEHIALKFGVSVHPGFQERSQSVAGECIPRVPG